MDPVMVVIAFIALDFAVYGASVNPDDVCDK
jgi:hypothetical protein